MKVLLFILSFIVVFVILQYMAEPWFAGMKAIKTLFSLSISLILVISAFGVADMLMADKPEE